MSDSIFCRAVGRKINRRDCYRSKKDPYCQSCRHLKEKIEPSGHITSSPKDHREKKETKPKPKAPASVFKNSKSPADDFLSPLKAELSPENRLFLIRSKFRENLLFHYCSSEEIFRAVYGDPRGAEYWRGWFDKAGLTVPEFAELMGIHVAGEYSDKNPPGKDLLISREATRGKVVKVLQDLGEMKPPKLKKDDVDELFHKNPLWQKCENSRKAVILHLKEAAGMKVLPFVGDVEVLLHMKAETINQGWFYDRKEGKVNSLTDIKIYPRETLKWFADSPIRADLLPESLRLWWATQSNNLLGAIKIKIGLLNKKGEGEWRQNWNNLYDGIPPQNPRNVSEAVNKFTTITLDLIRTKAQSMMKLVTDLPTESNLSLDEDAYGKLKAYILHFFQEEKYIERWSSFLGAVQRKFARLGLIFNESEQRIVQLGAAAFHVGVKNTIRDARLKIESDFVIIGQRLKIHGASPYPKKISDAPEPIPTATGRGPSLVPIKSTPQKEKHLQPTVGTEEPIVGYKGIARFMKCHPDTVRKKFRPEGLPVRETESGRVLAYASEINAWVETHTTKNRKKKTPK